MTQEKAIAVLTLHDADTMPKDQRSKIATWLRQKADMLVKEGGPKGKIAKRFRARYLVGIVSSFLLMVMVTGCVTKYDDIVSDFHTIQNSNQCTTVAFDQRKFNAETVEPPAISCPCDELKPVKRLVVKAGQSPEVMACLAPLPAVQVASDEGVRLPGVTDGVLTMNSVPVDWRTIKASAQNSSYFIPSGHLHHQASLASTYVPAIGNAAAGGAIGGGIAAAQAARMTQSVTGSTVRTSTLVLDGTVPPGVAR